MAIFGKNVIKKDWAKSDEVFQQICKEYIKNNNGVNYDDDKMQSNLKDKDMSLIILCCLNNIKS